MCGVLGYVSGKLVCRSRLFDAAGAGWARRGIEMTRFTKLYGWSLILGSLAVLVAFFVSRVDLIREPFEHNYAEGIVLYQILHVLPPSDAYRSITNYPHIVFHYTPFYHVLANLIGQTVMGSFYAARTLSFVASLLVGAVCGCWVFLGSSRRLSSKPVLYGAAMSASAFALRSVSVTMCSVLIRSDMFGIGLAMLGLFLFVRFGNGKMSLWISLLLFVAGLYCKQTLIGAPIACLVALWLMNRRTFLNAVIFLLLVGGGVMGGMELATSGQFVRHVFLYNMNPFSMARVIDGLAAHLAGAYPVFLFGTFPVFLCGLAMLVVNAVAFRKHWRHLGALLTRSTRVRAAFCASVFAIAGMATSISIGKLGAAAKLLSGVGHCIRDSCGFLSRGGTCIRRNFTRQSVADGGRGPFADLVLSSGPFVYRGFVTSDFMKQRSRDISRLMVSLYPGYTIRSGWFFPRI